MRNLIAKRSIFFIVSITIIISGCDTPPATSLKNIKWILGKWESKNEDGILYEYWQKLNDSTYKGHAYAVSFEGDTTFSEKASIVESKGTITYSVKVNDDETTDFLLVENNTFCVFENQAHDYPQRIIYATNKSDTLYARVEGTVDGEFSAEEFHYRKAKKKVLSN